MSHEWLIIVLPVVFALGWFAARLDIRHIRRSAATLPRAYLRGLRELLNGNDSKALDAFSDLAQIDTLPPELQFTVGELSRRRGDYQRALITHRQLHENEKLPASVRNRGLWELVNDCAAMGMVDVAESRAKELADAPEYRQQVFEFLLQNYQRRRRYAEALDLIENADENTRQLQRLTTAHLHCARAEQDAAEATTQLGKALAAHPGCARARLRLAAIAGDTPAEALAHYAALEQDAPAYLWQAADGMMTACEADGDAARGAETLLRWLREFPSPMLFKAVVAVFERQAAAGGDAGDAARRRLDAVLQGYVVEHGGMAAAAHFIARQMPDGHTRQWLAVQQILAAGDGKAFFCDDCGYAMNQFAWQCPCCLRWESLKQS